MKPHLTSLVLALALAAASQSTAATVTMNGKDYVFDDASILTAGKALTTGVPDAQAGATWLGGGQRYNIAGNASLANYGTLVIGSGSLDGTEVSGGQLYLSTYDKEGAITIDNDLIVGASTYSEGNWNSYCSLRFDPASGRIVLAGTVVLAADTAFSVQRNNNYIDGGINGAGQMLSLSFQNDNSVLNLAGGATLGTLRNYNLQSASEGAAGSVNLNAAKSGGNASDNTTYTIGTKSGSMTLNANTGVTLNLTEANGGVINAQTGSNVAVETVSRGATLNAASGSNVTVGFVGSGGVFNAAAGSTISYTGATLAGDVTGDSTFNWTADSLSVTGATFSAGSVTVAAGRDLTFDASTNITVGQMVLAGGVVNGLKVTAGTTLSQTAASTLSGLVLDGGTISFADGDLFTYSMTGSLTLGSNRTTLDFSALALDTSVKYTLISGFDNANALAADFDESAYFFITHAAAGWEVTVDTAANALVLQQKVNLLTWNNAATDTNWDLTTSNWTDKSGAAASFNSGYDVIFDGTDATLTIGSGVSSANVYVTNNARLTLEGNALTATSGLTIGGGASLTLTGAAASVAGTTTILDASTLTLASAGHFAGQTVSVETGGKLTLAQTGSLGANAAVTGEGTVEINWGGSGNNIAADINAKLANFTGTLAVTSGRYNAGNNGSALNATAFDVSGAGQIYLTGGTWAQTFNLSGTGWKGDNGKTPGSVRFEGNANITGTINLTGDAELHVYAANNNGIISGTINGNNHILTKSGAGTLSVGSRDFSSVSEVNVSKGVFYLSSAGNYQFNAMTVASGASLRFNINASSTFETLNMSDGSILDLYNLGGGTLNAKTMNVTGDVQVTNTYSGNSTMQGQIVGNEGTTNTLTFTKGQPNAANALDIQSSIKGKLDIVKEQVTGSTITLSGTNTYEGDTSVSAGTLVFSGSTSGKANNYVATGGTITVSGEHGQIANDGISLKRNGSLDATLQNATVSTTGIRRNTEGTRGVLANAVIEIKARGSVIEGMDLSNSLLKMTSAGSLSLVDVAFSGAIALDNVSFSSDSVIAGGATFSGTGGISIGKTGGVSISSSEGLAHTFAGIDKTAGASLTTTNYALTLTGTLNLDLTNDLLCNSDLAGKNSAMIWLEGLTLGEGGALALSEHLTAGFKDGEAAVSPTLLIDSYTSSNGVAGTVVYVDFSPAVMPEPTSATLSLLGISVLLMRRRRKETCSRA